MAVDRTAARHQRERRRGLALGLAQFTIEGDAALIDRLIEHGYLTEAESEDRQAKERALSQALTRELCPR